MSVNLESLSNDDFPCRKIMGLGAHHFDILQCVACWRHGIGVRVNMRHIAPILSCITGIAGLSVNIAEDESEHVSAIDYGFEVIDLRIFGGIPRAVEALAVLSHAWELGGLPKEGKVSQVHCRPESDKQQRSSSVCVRHGSCGIQHSDERASSR